MGQEPGGQALTDSLSQNTGDAAQWWEAYCLAENDEVDELGRRARNGDNHARRKLAQWLAERGRAREAVPVIRPLADAGEDVAQLWLARWLADCGQLGELRQRADAGDDHAVQELGQWLADHREFEELREFITAREGRLSRLRPPGDVGVLRVFADLGDDGARRSLAGWLARRGQIDELRRRVGTGDEHASRQLAGPDERVITRAGEHRWPPLRPDIDE
jgi:hypothetical protein